MQTYPSEHVTQLLALEAMTFELAEPDFLKTFNKRTSEILFLLSRSREEI
jgi:hypothetical protein